MQQAAASVLYTAEIRQSSEPGSAVLRRFDVVDWIIRRGVVQLDVVGAEGAAVSFRVDGSRPMVAGSRGCELVIGRGMHQFGGAVLVVERVAQEDAE